MQKKSVTKNYMYNLIYQVLVLILPLVTTPYISRVLGAENIGIYSYTTSISAYFILFGSLGVALYGQREIAYKQGNKKDYSKTFWEIVIFRAITIFISIIIFYLTFARGDNEYSIYYKILILEIIGNCIDITWFFQGLEDFKKAVIRNLIVKIVSIVCTFTFVKSSGDLWIYFMIYVSSILIGNGSLWLSIPKYIEKVNRSELKIARHLRPTIMLFIPQIAIQVYTVLDRTMIGAIITDKSEVGYYDQSQKIIKMLLAVITSLGTVMLTRISNNLANGEKEKVKAYMKKSFRVVFMLSFPMIFGIFAVSGVFVPLFFGQGYERVIILMNVISPILLLIGLSNVTGTQYLLPTKRQREFSISVICGAIINFIMNISLIWNYGAVGASIGTVIAEFTVTAIQVYFVRLDFNFKEILKSSKNYLISAIIMFILCLVLVKALPVSVISLLIEVVSGVAIYGIMLIVLKDEFVLDILKRIKNKLR